MTTKTKNAIGISNSSGSSRGSSNSNSNSSSGSSSGGSSSNGSNNSSSGSDIYILNILKVKKNKVKIKVS